MSEKKWVSFQVEAGTQSAALMGQLLQRFQEHRIERAKAGQPEPDAACWVTDSLSERSTFYFSPEAAAIFSETIRENGGSPGDPPAPDGLNMLFGLTDAWERMLGGRPQSPYDRR